MSFITINYNHVYFSVATFKTLTSSTSFWHEHRFNTWWSYSLMALCCHGACSLQPSNSQCCHASGSHEWYTRPIPLASTSILIWLYDQGTNNINHTVDYTYNSLHCSTQSRTSVPALSCTTLTKWSKPCWSQPLLTAPVWTAVFFNNETHNVAGKKWTIIYGILA